MQKASDICFTSLPQISWVEVLHLASTQVQKHGIWMKARIEDARDAPCVAVQDEDAKRIARLWRLLAPDNKEIRCHTPLFGLRFYQAEHLELEASLCPKCYNIFGWSNENKVSAEFDAEHPKAQELLALLQQVWNSKEQL